MRFFFLVGLGLTLLALPGHAQRKAIFYDSLGALTTFELHWAQTLTGRYESRYDKATHRRTLTPLSPAAYAAELRRTEARISTSKRVGTPFPAIGLSDLAGHPLLPAELAGKVVVLNFWFVGCAPCEMERPALNALADVYAADPRVIFLSIARTDTVALRRFLADYPVSYRILPVGRTDLAKTFGVSAFPTTIILSPDATVRFSSTGSGVGIAAILRRQIEATLARQ